jgi:hypothetical protein
MSTFKGLFDVAGTSPPARMAALSAMVHESTGSQDLAECVANSSKNQSKNDTTCHLKTHEILHLALENAPIDMAVLHFIVWWHARARRCPLPTQTNVWLLDHAVSDWLASVCVVLVSLCWMVALCASALPQSDI